VSVRRLNGAQFRDLAAPVLRDGYRLRFQACGGSMGPFIKDGDVLEVAPLEKGRVRHGDVLLVEAGDGRWLAHRVIKTGRRDGERCFLLKGDACPAPDGWFDTKHLLGRVLIVDRGGRRIDLTSSSARLSARLWVTIVPWTSRFSWLPECPRHFLRRLLYKGLSPD